MKRTAGKQLAQMRSTASGAYQPGKAALSTLRAPAITLPIGLSEIKASSRRLPLFAAVPAPCHLFVRFSRISTSSAQCEAWSSRSARSTGERKLYFWSLKKVKQSYKSQHGYEPSRSLALFPEVQYFPRQNGWSVCLLTKGFCVL